MQKYLLSILWMHGGFSFFLTDNWTGIQFCSVVVLYKDILKSSWTMDIEKCETLVVAGIGVYNYAICSLSIFSSEEVSYSLTKGSPLR